MSDRYVCSPCKIVDDDAVDGARTIVTCGPSLTWTILEEAKASASRQWQTGEYELIVISRVDDLANVRVIAIVGYHELSSRYDLPLKIAEIDQTLPRLARVIRDYAERDCPVLEDV